MKTLNINNKNFDKSLDSLLLLRKKKLQSNSVSVTNIIKNTLDEFVIDGIQYKPINEKYSQFKFKDIEIGYEHNTIDTSRSIYDKIRYDSEFEKEVIIEK